MKIYTKRGDQGETSLFGGSRVKKYNLRIEAYGTLDELNAFNAQLCHYIAYSESLTKFIIDIQDDIFVIGSQLAVEPGNTKVKVPEISASRIEDLEKEIDKYDLELPPLKSFVLPGTRIEVASAHICRTICRRAERLVTELREQEQVHHLILPYLNRLSDYYFTLARKITQDLKIKETPWIPK